MAKLVEEDVKFEGADFASILEHSFPRAVPESVFVDHASAVLNAHGFTSDTSINLVSTCRDELCRPFTELLNTKWKDYFNIASLAGFVFCGRTGFKAAMAHAPVVNGKERYVFWVAPHIALDSEGQVGKCMRHGREHPSSACGALLAVQKEIQSGTVSMKLEQTDMEQSLVKQELISHLPYGKVPDLVELTYAAYECILKEVLDTCYASINPNMCEFAVVAGIQVHGPMGQNYFWPGTMFKVAGEERVEVDLYEEYAEAVSSWHAQLKGWNANESLALLQKRSREARLAVIGGDLKKLKHTGINLMKVLDNRSHTLLHTAAMHNQPEIADFLLKQAQDNISRSGSTTSYLGFVDELDIDHKSAMDYAIEHGHFSVALILKKYGGGLQGELLRNWLIKAVENLNLEEFGRYVEFAKNRQEALAATDRDGRSLLHLCVAIKEKQMDKVKRQEELIKNLMNLGAPASVDFFGNEVLHNVSTDTVLSKETISAVKQPTTPGLKPTTPELEPQPTSLKHQSF